MNELSSTCNSLSHIFFGISMSVLKTNSINTNKKKNDSHRFDMQIWKFTQMIKQLKLNKTRLNTFVLNINTSLLNTLTLHLLYCYKLRLNKTDNISHVEEIKFSQPLVSRKKSKHEYNYYTIYGWMALWKSLRGGMEWNW